MNMLRHHCSVLLKSFSDRFSFTDSHLRGRMYTAADVVVDAVVYSNDDFACAWAGTERSACWASCRFVVAVKSLAFFEFQRGCRVDNEHFRVREFGFKEFRVQTTRFEQRFYVLRGYRETASNFSFIVRVFRPKYAAFFDDNLFFFRVLSEECWKPRVKICFGEF